MDNRDQAFVEFQRQGGTTRAAFNAALDVYETANTIILAALHAEYTEYEHTRDLHALARGIGNILERTDDGS